VSDRRAQLHISLAVILHLAAATVVRAEQRLADLARPAYELLLLYRDTKINHASKTQEGAGVRPILHLANRNPQQQRLLRRGQEKVRPGKGVRHRLTYVCQSMSDTFSCRHLFLPSFPAATVAAGAAGAPPAPNGPPLPLPAADALTLAPAPVEPGQLMPTIPGYEVLGELGRGGMGVVR